MNKITAIGLDLAKNVFHVVGFDSRNKETMEKMLRRSHVIRFFNQLPPCVVAMGACSSGYNWAQELTALGHTIRLISARHVKPLVRGNKNDYNNARSIFEALSRLGMGFVTIKTVQQQDAQVLERLRQGCLGDRTASAIGCVACWQNMDW